jgi:hypothetical protein
MGAFMIHRLSSLGFVLLLNVCLPSVLFSMAWVNEKATAQYTKLPVSADVCVVENVTIRFETKKDVIDTLRGPLSVHEEAVQLMACKFEPVLGEALYPS